MLNFKRRTLGKQLQWLENSCGLRRENDSGEHQMENNSGGVTLVVDSKLQVNN